MLGARQGKAADDASEFVDNALEPAYDDSPSAEGPVELKPTDDASEPAADASEPADDGWSLMTTTLSLPTVI